jgi:hypothetical protein
MTMNSVRINETVYYLPFVDEIRMDPADDADLGASVELAGRVREAVVCWQQKSGGDSEWVIDGAHRLLHAQRLGLKEVPVRHESCKDQKAALALCHELNDARRQQDRNALNKSRKGRIEKVAEMRRQGKSLRGISDTLGVSLVQVQRDLEISDSGVPGDGTPESDGASEHNGSGATSATVKGKDGKTYRATSGKLRNGVNYCDKCRAKGKPKKGCKGCAASRKVEKARQVNAVETKSGAYEGETEEVHDAEGELVPIEAHAAFGAAKAEGKAEAATDSRAANGTADGRARNGKPRNGRPAFDDRVIDDLLGKLTRAANERSKEFGRTAVFQDFWDRLEGTAKAWKRWQLEREKATA